MKTLFIDNLELKIGSNQLENQVLIDKMEDKHTWFHIDNLPSAHLTIPVSFENLKKKDIHRIALELKKNSKYKKYNSISVIYTHRDSLKLTNTPGKVFITGKKQSIKV